MAEYQFQTEVNQLLKLIIHSMYSNKDIFLREIISNASDALDKLNYLKISNDAYKSFESEPRIDIFFDPKKPSLTVQDTGIGMSEKELNANLGTIAKSGTKAFIEKISKDKNAADSNLIGQFGVGFYSAFMASKRINVYTKKAGGKKILKWSSDGTNSYSIEEVKAKSEEAASFRFNDEKLCGTAVEMILNDDSREYASKWKIEDLIKKYSNHIAFPIFLHYEKNNYNDKGETTGTESVIDQVNSASAIWKRPKSELKKEDYESFYKAFAHDSEAPLYYVHTHAEGAQEYTTLFYVPKNAPIDMFNNDYENGIKLYVKRVFITDSDRELLPPYLRFVRGIIDSEDLPLNVSREILQQNRILENIKLASLKKLISEFKKMGDEADEAMAVPEVERSEEQREAISKWGTFIRNYNRPLKEGIYSDFRNKEELLEVIRFKSTDPADAEKDAWTSLAKYVSRMKEGQKSIYYIAGTDEKKLRSNPLLEAYRAKGFEVLIAADQMDDIVMPSVGKYKGFPVISVDRAGSDSELGSDEKEKDEAFKPIQEKIKKALGERVANVILSKRLTDSPSCITFSENSADFQIEKLMKALGQNAPTVIPNLEINMDHGLVKKIDTATDEKLISDISEILLDQALITAGADLNDPARFIKAMNSLLLGIEPNAAMKEDLKEETPERAGEKKDEE